MVLLSLWSSCLISEITLKLVFAKRQEWILQLSIARESGRIYEAIIWKTPVRIGCRDILFMLEHKENQQRIAQRKQRIRPTCGVNAKNGSSTLPLLLLANISSPRPWLNIPGLPTETLCSTGPYTWQPSMIYWTFSMNCSQDSLRTSQGPEWNEKVAPLVPKLLKIKNSNSRARHNVSVEPS